MDKQLINCNKDAPRKCAHGDHEHKANVPSYSGLAPVKASIPSKSQIIEVDVTVEGSDRINNGKNLGAVVSKIISNHHKISVYTLLAQIMLKSEI